MNSPNYGEAYTYNTADFIKNILAAIFFAGREPIVGPLWFAYVLSLAFIGYALLTWTCNRFFIRSPEKIRLVACVTLAVISAILSNKFNLTINRFSNTIVVMLLIAIGQFIYQKKKVCFNSRYIFFISLLLSWQSAVLNGNINLNANQYQDLFHLICGSLSSLYVICFISKKISGTFIGDKLRIIGTKSFYIMALHFLAFKIFASIIKVLGVETDIDFLTPSVGNNFILLLGYLLFGVSFPVITALIVNKIKTVFAKNKYV